MKKLKLLFLLAFLVLSGGAFADTEVSPGPTQVTFPIYNYFGDNICQTVYPGDLTGSGFLTGISLYNYGEISATYNDVEVYVQTWDDSKAPLNFKRDGTLVYKGDIVCEEGWIKLDFNEVDSFIQMSMRNLLLR
ncbi:MAG: hypothetical protein ACEPOW_12935 [Bacteroidales bacterium]